MTFRVSPGITFGFIPGGAPSLSSVKSFTTVGGAFSAWKKSIPGIPSPSAGATSKSAAATRAIPVTATTKRFLVFGWNVSGTGLIDPRASSSPSRSRALEGTGFAAASLSKDGMVIRTP
jgi:hypothetical protein